MCKYTPTEILLSSIYIRYNVYIIYSLTVIIIFTNITVPGVWLVCHKKLGKTNIAQPLVYTCTNKHHHVSTAQSTKMVARNTATFQE